MTSRTAFATFMIAMLPAFAQEHKEIKLDTKVFDNYAGTYQLAPSLVMTISREGDQFFAELTGQGKNQIFAESERSFFLKVVDVQLTFDTDAQGKATQMTLHQNGANVPGKRVDQAQAAASVAALEKKVKDQTQDPRTDAAVRRLIAELRAGEPKYELMTPAFADVTRQQLPQLQDGLAQLGALQSVKFTGVGPAGADIYDVQFESGSTEWRIMLESDGKISTVGFRPQ